VRGYVGSSYKQKKDMQNFLPGKSGVDW